MVDFKMCRKKCINEFVHISLLLHKRTGLIPSSIKSINVPYFPHKQYSCVLSSFWGPTLPLHSLSLSLSLVDARHLVPFPTPSFLLSCVPSFDLMPLLSSHQIGIQLILNQIFSIVIAELDASSEFHFDTSSEFAS